MDQKNKGLPRPRKAISVIWQALYQQLSCRDNLSHSTCISHSTFKRVPGGYDG